MINVAAIRMQQFGVQFYQASLTASDIDKLVRFEVLNYGDTAQPPVRGGKARAGRGSLEGQLGSARAPHRVEREGLPAPDHPAQDRRARAVLRAVPAGARSAVDSWRRHHQLRREADVSGVGRRGRVGILKVPEREGILRAIDGQHRLLALHADIDHFEGEDFSVPAIIFDRLPEDHVVQMFVTINAKHTRLNASHLVSLSGRQLYRDEALATAHDVVRALNDREDSPLYDEIKLLGVGRGRVAQAPLAQELKKLFAADVFASRRRSDMHEDAKKFFVNYFKQIALVFGGAWNGRKYSIRSASALRAFVRVAPDVVRRLDQEHADRTDFRAIGRVIAPWGRRIGDLRFETEGAWKRSGTTVDSLAKELRLALQYPEGAAV